MRIRCRRLWRPIRNNFSRIEKALTPDVIYSARKHGVDFVAVARIFDGPILELEDRRCDYGEVRFLALGEIVGQRFSPWKLRSPFPRIGRPPDASLTTAGDWKDARIVWPQTTEPVTLRLDRDVLAWFGRQGRGYKARINAVLRAFVEAQER